MLACCTIGRVNCRYPWHLPGTDGDNDEARYQSGNPILCHGVTQGTLSRQGQRQQTSSQTDYRNVRRRCRSSLGLWQYATGRHQDSNAGKSEDPCTQLPAHVLITSFWLLLQCLAWMGIFLAQSCLVNRALPFQRMIDWRILCSIKGLEYFFQTFADCGTF